MELAIELRSLVHQSVALLGDVIKSELGSATFTKIEGIRKKMTELREATAEDSLKELRKLYQSLERTNSQQRFELAQSFTLMLELMNVCESAYRSHRLMQRPPTQFDSAEGPKAIIFVLTAHPTEARSPVNIAIFHQIQNLLIGILKDSAPEQEVQMQAQQQQDLFHLLKVAWRISIVRNRSPKVKDEAEHIYSLIFRDGILFSLLDAASHRTPFYIRSWVGGDKDGHPGVDEKVLLESLTLSRQKLLILAKAQIKAIRETLELLGLDDLQKDLVKVEDKLQALKVIRPGDAQKVSQLRKELNQLRDNYQESLGSLHPQLRRLCQVLHAFPGLVVPLELRESSDVLMSKPDGKKPLAIDRMLVQIAKLSKGCDPRWYARGFIISMTESMEHIQAAARKQKQAFGEIRLPIIPLFEESSSLADSERIVTEMLQDRQIHKAAKAYWDGLVELMVGYSDSSKEAGALASRLAIAEALPKLEKVCKAAGLSPLFFHGSGGSVDRGGGSIEDQTAWWPRTALERYKVTVQGEMVERSMASPEIAQSQIEKIILSAQKGLKEKTRFVHNKALEIFAGRISEQYREQITNPFFLQVVEAATPYSYLKVLKIGSRPAKRTKELTVKGLRAIPWVLCWTQTRVLFQTWWGAGTAWEQSSASERQAIRKAFQDEPVFHSYIKALGFTLAKIELPVWKIYLEQSNLTKQDADRIFQSFQQELQKTLQFYHEVTGEKNLMWFRTWLGESIQLRSPMIHPLNLLQILSQKEKDVRLLRLTVTGISSGMLTTG